jgi:hypothetical protein
MSLSVAYDDDEFELELESNTLSEGWPAPAPPLSKRASCLSVLEALSEPVADLDASSSSSDGHMHSSSSSDVLETAVPIDVTATEPVPQQLAPDLSASRAEALESGVEDAVVRVLMGEAIDWAEHQRAKMQQQQLQQQKLTKSAQTRLRALPSCSEHHGITAGRRRDASTAAATNYQVGVLEGLTSMKCHDVVMPLRSVAAASANDSAVKHNAQNSSSTHAAESVAQLLARAQAVADSDALAERFRVQYLAVMSEIARAGISTHTESAASNSSSQCHDKATDAAAPPLAAAAAAQGEAVASSDAALKCALMASLREMLTDQRIIALIQAATLAKFAAAQRAAASVAGTTSEALHAQHTQQ